MGQLNQIIDNYKDFRQFTVRNPDLKIKTRDVSVNSVIKRIVFHCTDADGWTPDRLSKFFVEERKFPICGYHYYVQADTVWQMVGENVITYHAAHHNSDTVSFSIDYNPTRDEKLNIALNPKVYENAIKVATYLCLKFRVTPDNIFGHRELPFTGYQVMADKNDHTHLLKTCPGLKINLNQFRMEVTKSVQKVLSLVEDGVSGPKTVYAIKNHRLV